MNNKKGQQMTLGTIIAIVLGLVVLVFLIFGFSTGWSNMWEKITGFGGGNVNVETVKTSCALACSKAVKYDFCTKTYNVMLQNNVKTEAASCSELVRGALPINDATKDAKAKVATAASDTAKATAQAELDALRISIGVEECPAITC